MADEFDAMRRSCLKMEATRWRLDPGMTSIGYLDPEPVTKYSDGVCHVKVADRHRDEITFAEPLDVS
jgi:hypothetical protein